ncbi:MAG: glycosyltransferase family 2 protein [Myxococcota bacterium]
MSTESPPDDEEVQASTGPRKSWHRTVETPDTLRHLTDLGAMVDLRSVAVIIPALNEEISLPGVLKSLPDGPRVIVVDNGSTDDTQGVAQRAGATVVQEPHRGYGSAVLAGMSHLSADPPVVVVILDADHADRPELLPRLVAPILNDEADMVLSDRSRTAAPGAMSIPQAFGNAVATNLMWAVSGHRYRDMGPFRAVRWASLTAMQMRDPTWGWNVEMQLKAVHLGIRIQEIAVPYGARRGGVSKISGTAKGVVKAGARILWAVGRYGPRPTSLK